MKQSQKKDLILKTLYEQNDDRNFLSIPSIISDLNLSISDPEMERIMYSLRDEGLVAISDPKFAMITSKGIDYVEHNSFHRPGQSMLSINYNINVHDSKYVNVQAGSPNATIKQEHKNTLVDLFSKIEEILKNNDKLDDLVKTDLLEDVEEMKEKAGAGKKLSRSMWNGFLNRTANISQISSLCVQIGQILWPTISS